MAKTKTDKAAKSESRYIAEDFNLQNIELSSEIALNFCHIGIDRTMNKYN